ncbi:MAG: histidinol phosphate phosphatase domain-containing protein [Proteobacteria bacterium]|nr:histidinol phosphate phosphatase domain-containing protein [Pseudomonadota bacterium]
MIDLHTHTLFSDGVLLPSELARRAEVKGYRFIGLADHVDASNIDWVVPRIAAAAAANNPVTRVQIVPCAELTHVPPALFDGLTRRARDLGAAVVVAHGESPVEPVAPGTNRAAIEAGVDILAHPGLITREEAALAASKGVLLEITTRKGHSLTNGHVARLALETGAGLVLNTDAHEPGDLVDIDFAILVARGAGLDPDAFERMQARAMDLIQGRGLA